jgi:methylated-DNA-[protein]-cysteine S-methyltransferase
LETYRDIKTPIGKMRITANENSLTAITLINTKEGDPISESSSSAILDEAEKQLQEYFAGTRKQFDLPLDWGDMPEFRKHTLQTAAQIPWGMVITYGDLAKLSGNDLAARACGSAMANNPFMIVVPCHRVIGSDNALHGFSAEGGLNVKQQLLEMEGVEFKNGKVVR